VIINRGSNTTCVIKMLMYSKLILYYRICNFSQMLENRYRESNFLFKCIYIKANLSLCLTN
jgi:hypothetical protein